MISYYTFGIRREAHANHSSRTYHVECHGPASIVGGVASASGKFVSGPAVPPSIVFYCCRMPLTDLPMIVDDARPPNRWIERILWLTLMHGTYGVRFAYLCRHNSLPLHHQLTIRAHTLFPSAQFFVAFQTGDDTVIAATRTFRRTQESLRFARAVVNLSVRFVHKFFVERHTFVTK